MQRRFQKTNRAFTVVRQYAWIFTLTVAFGGLWFPRLGLLVLGVIAALAIISLFNGRFWCGNFCAHGSLFDQLLLPLSRNVAIPTWLKSRWTQGAVLVVFMFNLISGILAATENWGTALFWDRLGLVFVGSYLVVTVAGGLLSLVVTPRTWCQVCPMGTMQVLMDKFGRLAGLTRSQDAKITMTDPAKCTKCGKCARVCPMQLSPYQELNAQHQFEHENCLRCSVCIKSCPAKILTLETDSRAA